MYAKLRKSRNKESDYKSEIKEKQTGITNKVDTRWYVDIQKELSAYLRMILPSSGVYPC